MTTSRLTLLIRFCAILAICACCDPYSLAFLAPLGLIIPAFGRRAVGREHADVPLGLVPSPSVGCSSYSSVANIYSIESNISRLGECKIVFCGFSSTTSKAVNIASGDFPAVGAYISSGGRVWVSSHPSALSMDNTMLATFLSDVGSTMALDDSVYGTIGVCELLTPGVANVSSGASFYAGRHAAVTGGTSVFLDGSSNVVVAVEAIGDGFLFLTGWGFSFSTAPGGCSLDCDFANRLYDYEDGDII